MSDDGMTMQEICEVCSWVFHGDTKHAREIYEMDKRGELWPVFLMFNQAQNVLAMYRIGPRDILESV